MVDICGDLLIEILSRLPVKSLVRFKGVSRSWYDLINHPDFIKLHLHRSIQTNSNRALIFGDKYFPYLSKVKFDTWDHFRVADQPLRPSLKVLDIMGSCNGLLWITYSRHGELYSSHLLFNPATHSFNVLPQLRDRNNNYEWSGSGLGYDSVRDDYKIVWITCTIIRFNELRKDLSSKVMIYSLKDNSWRRGKDLPYHPDPHKQHAALANGYLHWTAHQNVETYKKIIFGFNISDESYHEVEQPQYEKYLCDVQMSAVDECLCLTSSHNAHYDFWIMKEYGEPESWTMFLRIKEEYFVRNTCPIMRKSSLKVIGFSKNRKELFYMYDEFCLASYNLETRTIIRRNNKFRDPFICVESLVSVKKVHRQKYKESISG